MNLVKALGIEVVRVTPEEAVIEMEIGPRHLRGDAARGLNDVVHGGVYCCLIETATSVGAAAVCESRQQPPPFGIENSASFIRSAHSGRVRATAKPISAGRTSQVWEATVTNAQGQVLATGRVRFLSPPPSKVGT